VKYRQNAKNKNKRDLFYHNIPICDKTSLPNFEKKELLEELSPHMDIASKFGYSFSII
jgi:hypothetical protein